MPWADGKLKAKVADCKYIETNDGIPAFIVSFTVAAHLVEPDEEAKTDERGNRWPKVGEDRDWFCSLKPIKGGARPGASDMKAFCSEASPECAELVKKIEHGDNTAKQTEALGKELEELYEFIVGDDNPLADTELILTTNASKSAKTGNPFTRHSWTAA